MSLSRGLSIGVIFVFNLMSDAKAVMLSVHEICPFDPSVTLTVFGVDPNWPLPLITRTPPVNLIEQYVSFKSTISPSSDKRTPPPVSLSWLRDILPFTCRLLVDGL